MAPGRPSTWGWTKTEPSNLVSAQTHTPAPQKRLSQMLETKEVDRGYQTARPNNSLTKNNARDEISSALNCLLADFFTLYVKTKNFHWHMSGPHFRDYHLLLDEQADQIFGVLDLIAERVRKMDRATIRSIGQISRLQRIADSEIASPTPLSMLRALHDDNVQLISYMHEVHYLSGSYGDVATTSVLETWIDEADRRVWFLSESARGS